MVTLRRLVAMLLLAVFGLPVALSSVAVGQGTDAGLPACCRRTGKHQCGMSLAERNAAVSAAHGGRPDERVWQAPIEHCPYCPAAPVVSAHTDLLLPGAVLTGFGALYGPAGPVGHAECCRRLAREGGRQKRGPPSIFLA